MNQAKQIGVIGYLSLNKREMHCIEMALYFLTLQLTTPEKHPFFVDLRRYQVDYIANWFNQYKARYPVVDNECAIWPVWDIEDVEWLALALEIGITEDTQMMMAADEANYHHDMGCIQSYHTNLSAALYRYGVASGCKRQLLKKIRDILNNPSF